MAGLSFTHRFEPGAKPDALPLLLLHGTGGNEHDLISLGQAIAPGAALLAPRGKVLEHGMPRFFRRLAEGVFDEDDVRRRAHELADFVEAARKERHRHADCARLFQRRQHCCGRYGAAARSVGRRNSASRHGAACVGCRARLALRQGRVDRLRSARSDRVTGTRSTAQEPARSCRRRGRAPERSRWSRANASRHHAGAGVAASSPFCDEVE